MLPFEIFFAPVCSRLMPKFPGNGVAFRIRVDIGGNYRAATGLRFAILSTLRKQIPGDELRAHRLFIARIATGKKRGQAPAVFASHAADEATPGVFLRVDF